MVDVTWYEIVIISAMIMVMGWFLSSIGYLDEGISIFVFMAMGLIGFLGVRVIRGRKMGWR
jgi:hypothetical protein